MPKNLAIALVRSLERRRGDDDASLEEARRYRLRAEEYLAIASQTQSRAAKAQWVILAHNYNVLAQQLEARAKQIGAIIAIAASLLLAVPGQHPFLLEFRTGTAPSDIGVNSDWAKPPR